MMTDDTGEPNGGPENTGQIQGGKFPKGKSGNPRGKPKGSRHKATLAIESLLEGQADALTQKAVELALDGDVTALRLCLDRIAPARKDAPVMIDIPDISTADGTLKAGSAIVAAVASGEISPDEGQKLMSLIEVQRRQIETADLEARLAALESDLEGKE
jgi:hypothetical protein